MSGVRRFLRSMTGRIFLILVLGIAVFGSGALFAVDAFRRADLQRLREERAVDRLQNFVSLAGKTTGEVKAELMKGGSEGAHPAPATAAGKDEDAAFARLLRSRLTGASVGKVVKADPGVCFSLRGPGGRGGRGGGRQGGPPFPEKGGFEGRRGGPGGPGGPGDRFRGPQGCWLVDTTLADGTRLRMAVDTPPGPWTQSHAFDPLFLGVLAGGAAILALLLAQMTGRPLRRLAEAAAQLGRDLDRAPLAEVGPIEVREAAQAFNAMQKKLRQNLAQRTEMLAAITHDLQTPLTRLRLRLEKVTDEELRERLVADLAAMQLLIREGLEYARSADTDEPVATLDLDSMLESLVDDEADAGRQASLTGASGCDVAVRPQAFRRCLLNLIDNAIAYGGSAEVSATRGEGDQVVIRIRDHGPGVPDQDLEAVFEPFVRLEDSRSRDTGGSGLGLTIARTLAEKNKAVVGLRNHPDGGCEATVTLPAAWPKKGRV